ncbi:hypothetical protein Mal4_04650 [Maioricimonas rarisocia]|uniref:Tetratricopeptide repeat protein n=1 Tax=Maioricimonas rarisocia TaxID=2528026 RepID=A0A517Z128_9PLAN|nr:hypothetical protein [Maioricimonas rarisocia]QDU36181.1 hypothetical protein Mal4_04650 [Maioricimonas rarisocia]
MNLPPPLTRLILLLACLPLVAGCASHADRLHQFRSDFFAGNLEQATAEIDELIVDSKEDADVLKLDRAVVELASGRPQNAERLLREVRDRFDHLEQTSAAELAASMVTDDTAISYAGEDHEKVLILSLLALSNLMSDGTDATAYSLQIADKQRQLIEAAGGVEEHPELAQRQVALGPYIQAALQEESFTSPDDVIRSRTRVVEWQPGFRDGKADLERARYETHSQPGHGVVYVFTLVGRGPTKEESLEIPTQAALLIADRIISHNASQSLPPTVAPIRVPKVVTRANRIQEVSVRVNDEPAGSTATLVDVGELGRVHYEAKYPEVIGRAIARRVLKKSAVYAVKEQVNADASPLADVALTLAGIAWEATETPDTRCWGLLPDEIQVLRLELPAGPHKLTLQPADGYGPFGQPASVGVNVRDGHNAYVLANFPDHRLVGQILTNEAVE